MDDLANFQYTLPTSLRSELAQPMGDLIEGTTGDTIPILKRRLSNRESLLIAVGDVSATLLIEHDLAPELIITDGQTKREQLNTWPDWEGYEIMTAENPAAQITSETWYTLRDAIGKLTQRRIHIKISGEEDLLVLPLLIELPDDAIIIYGQPNKGAVLLKVEPHVRKRARSLISRMDRKSR